MLESTIDSACRAGRSAGFNSRFPWLRALFGKTLEVEAEKAMMPHICSISDIFRQLSPSLAEH